MLKQLSPETALKLAQELNIPIEQLVHTPRHIVLAKLAELAKQQGEKQEQEAQTSCDQGNTQLKESDQ